MMCGEIEFDTSLTSAEMVLTVSSLAKNTQFLPRI
jgi:hypothetical protein